MDTWTVGIQQHQLQQEEPAQEQEQPQTQRQTPVSDFSSLYSPHRAVSKLFPQSCQMSNSGGNGGGGLSEGGESRALLCNAG